MRLRVPFRSSMLPDLPAGSVQTLRARLYIRRRLAPLATLLPTLRWLGVAGLAFAALLGGYNAWFLSRQVGALEFTSHSIGVETGAVGVQGLAASDLDNDGDIDVVTAGLDGVKIYENKDNGTFSVKLVDDKKGERIQILDLNKNGSSDLLVTLLDTNPSVKWYDNRGTLEFSGTTISTGINAKAYAGDVDADGSPDVVVAVTDPASQLVSLQRWMNNGTGTFASTTLSADSGVTAVTVADIDNNGYRDVITGGTKGLQRWKTSDGLTWSRIDIDDGNQNRSHIVAADVDGDNKVDIVTGDEVKDLVVYYRNLDFSGFQRNVLEGDTDAKTVVVRDLDEDGDEDVIVAAQDNNAVYWYENNGSEEFTQRTVAFGLQSVFGVIVVDVDSDNDFDVLAGNYWQGTVYWYERLLAKPTASKPSSISQSTGGNSLITFKTTIADGDRDTTSMRAQYSLDGVTWYKPWLTSAKASAGSADLKNGNAYQVGTHNAIDTHVNGSVILTLVWDTKSVGNTGGPLVGEVSGVRLRVIPRDSRGTLGEVAISGTFLVDSGAPRNVGPLTLAAISDTEATLRWPVPTDSTAFVFALYYGTDQTAVVERRSEVWDQEDDAAMADIEAASTTVTGLEVDKRYTFKLFVTDAHGNVAAAPSVRGTTQSLVTSSPVAVSTALPTASPTTSILVSPVVDVSPSSSPGQTTSSPSPGASLSTPAVVAAPRPPVADASVDRVVNPNTLVILDGTASTDPDNDVLAYAWRQVDGPRVELFSEHTATPSLTAGGEGETYIFALTVRDSGGASSVDTVTIATRSLLSAQEASVPVTQQPEAQVPAEAERSGRLFAFLRLVTIALFSLSAFLTAISVSDRLLHVVARWRMTGLLSFAGRHDDALHTGTVVHAGTGGGIANAQVLVYDESKKLRMRETTNEKGMFSASFPAGLYVIAVKAEGFTFAPTSSLLPRTNAILYTGGTLAIRDSSQPLQLVIPMKPAGDTVGTVRTRVLHVWQSLQHQGQLLTWPLFVGGALLNTTLVFLAARPLYLVFEVLYVIMVIAKIVVELRAHPAYGFVRDAISHIPLDLGVVRLYEEGTNRLMMTRVTNTQGKFFALPAPGRYAITVTKPGYATFIKHNVEITSEHDATLQLTADLMPLMPGRAMAPAVA